jgi:hypothetical protein
MNIKNNLDYNKVITNQHKNSPLMVENTISGLYDFL